MPSSQVTDSLARSRKRRSRNRKACDCDTNCYASSSCKKHKKGDKEHSKEKGSRGGEVLGQRRSLRIQESVWKRTHAFESKEEPWHNERKREVRAAPLKKETKHVKANTRSYKETSSSGKDLSGKRVSDKFHYPENVESWDTRLRHRVRTLNVDSSNLQRKEIGKEENAEFDNHRNLQGTPRQAKRGRAKNAVESNNDEENSEPSMFVSWARKSKRRRRLHVPSEVEDKNAEEAVSLLTPDLKPSQSDKISPHALSYWTPTKPVSTCKGPKIGAEDIDNKQRDNVLRQTDLERNEMLANYGEHISDADDTCSSSWNVPDTVDGKSPVRKMNSITVLMASTPTHNILQAKDESKVDVEASLDKASVKGTGNRKDPVNDETRELANEWNDIKHAKLSLRNKKDKNKKSLRFNKSPHNGVSVSEFGSQDKTKHFECLRREAVENLPDSKHRNHLEEGDGPQELNYLHLKSSKKIDMPVSEHDFRNLDDHSKVDVDMTYANGDKASLEGRDGFRNGEGNLCHGTSADNTSSEHLEGTHRDDTVSNNPENEAVPLMFQNAEDNGQARSEENNSSPDVHSEHDINGDTAKLDQTNHEAAKQEAPLVPGESFGLQDTELQKQNETNSLKFNKSVITEGRKCGLCGVGNDGKPPKKLVHEGTDSDNETSGELQTATEDTMYSEYDGFGDDPGWLGRLLGPLSDRYGITGVWVHRLCAVWSPEVYFSGVGCLKNVRAALARGRSLKCSRCGRPGATIGCRVERCPRTYHLACGRANRCAFDHGKYLMACTDHVHLFRPRGRRYRKEMRKRKFQKMVFDLMKASNASMRKDLEDEEKYLENVGEDEEFLRRERKRYLRDVARISPVYIGGGSPSSNVSSGGWESLAGLDNVIQSLKEVVLFPLLYPECFDTLGITPPKGILLHGYPGTGKTLAVRALIGACSCGEKRIAYFARKGADCLGKYVGDAERQLRLLFQVAEQCQPSIIFFDEIDGLAPKRSRQQDQTHSSVVSTLLALMDGLKPRGSIVIIGATNRPDDLDPALRRPGRFDRELYFPLPSVREREMILDLHTRKWPKSPAPNVLSEVAKRTPGYAGADLQALCTQVAMIALKRQFPLHVLLHSAEHKSENESLPSLPLISVKESDWAAALSAAPQPCSRRAGSMAVNEFNAMALQSHMVPALIQPLTLLLLYFYQERLSFLPPKLFDAAKSIQNTLNSNAGSNNSHGIEWLSSLESLTPDSKSARDIEDVLRTVGLIHDGLEFLAPDFLLSSHERTSNGTKNCSFTQKENYWTSMERARLLGANTRGNSFRFLINGAPKMGQKYLASCLLQGFEGHVEIRKLSLPTMTQEGHGDIVQGLTHILESCRKIGKCIVYMPKMELWAVKKKIECSEDNSDHDVYEQMRVSEKKSMCEDNEGPAIVSEAWNIFVQVVDSLTSDIPIMFMATCELPGSSLPLKLKKFFTNKDDNSGTLTFKKSLPHLSVELPLSFEGKIILERSAKIITCSLIRRYIGLIHEMLHNEVFSSRNFEVTVPDRVSGEVFIESRINDSLASKRIEKEDYSGEEPKKQKEENCISDPCKGSESYLNGNRSVFGFSDKSLNPLLHKSFPYGSAKGKTTLQQAISMCGYQLLSCKQFAELCWVTSKLNGGPVANVHGPWKGWPFNSCVIGDDVSSKNVGDGPADQKDSSASSFVRGLVAVGLLALKGVYNTAQEVARDVRAVLEILVSKLRDKIERGKDSLQYFPLLAQAASLEDIVNSWAYMLRSLDISSSASGADDHSYTESKLQSTSDALDTIVTEKVDHQTAQQSVVFPSPCDTSNAVKGNDFRKTETPMVELDKPFEEQNSFCHEVPQGISSVNCHKVIKATSSALGSEYNNGSVNGSIEKSNAESLGKTGDHDYVYSFSGASEKNGSEHVHKSRPITNVEPSRKTNDDLNCVYQCCFECTNVLYLFVRQFLCRRWKDEGCYSELEKLHDLVGSCTILLHSMVAACSIFSSESGMCNSESSLLIKHKFCCCQDKCSFVDKRPSREEPGSRTEANIERECRCHEGVRREATRHLQDNVAHEMNMVYVFIDHILMFTLDSLDQTCNFHIHCQTKHFCLCSLTHNLSSLMPDS